MRVFCFDGMRHCDGQLEEVRFVEFPYEKYGDSAEIPVGSEKVKIWKEPFLTACAVTYILTACAVTYIWVTEHYDLLKSTASS